MKVLVLISVLAASVRSDVGLGYQYTTPATSYDVPFGSIGSLHHDRQYYHVNNPGFPSGAVLTTPASILQTPIHQFTSFTGGQGFNNFLKPSIVTSTEHPVINLKGTHEGFIGGQSGESFNTFLKPTIETPTEHIAINLKGGQEGFGGQFLNPTIVTSTEHPVINLKGTHGGFIGGQTGESFNTFLKPNIETSTEHVAINVKGGQEGFIGGQFLKPTIETSTEHTAINLKGTQEGFGSFQPNSQVEVQKHLYFFSAPEEHEEVRPRIIYPQAPAKKNVKLLFIKAPTFRISPIEIPAVPQNEEKTLVYVLVKKPEEETIIVPTPPPTKPTKPEVYFIKYKTQKEAEEAISNVQNGASGDASISANSVEGDNDFINRIQDNVVAKDNFDTRGSFDLTQKLGPDVVLGTTEATVLGGDSGIAFNSHPGFGGFVSTTEFPSTTLSSINFGSTTPTPIFAGGIHKVYGPPQKRSYFPNK